MGVPIVRATDIHGYRQVVDDGVNGRLVRVGDVARLAETVATLAREPERRAAMGAAGVKKTRARVRPQHVIDITLGLYAELLDRALSRAPPRPPRRKGTPGCRCCRW